jgi:hypothetical protein
VPKLTQAASGFGNEMPTLGCYMRFGSATTTGQAASECNTAQGVSSAASWAAEALQTALWPAFQSATWQTLQQ